MYFLSLKTLVKLIIYSFKIFITFKPTPDLNTETYELCQSIFNYLQQK